MTQEISPHTRTALRRDRRPRWQIEIAEAISDPIQLLSALGLDAPSLGSDLQAVLRRFPLRVPQAYLDRIRAGDPDDPLLRQVLPGPEESHQTPGFCADPVGDKGAMVAPGLIAKYTGRALLITTAACAIHCRYCFRRHFPYSEAHVSGERWARTLEHLQTHPQITEVILSGGDPLCLNDRRLSEMSRDLGTIPHLRYLRIHSRLPIVVPSRIDEHLMSWMMDNRLRTVVVVHANHPNEIDETVDQALGRLRAIGVPLFNQSVLLRGVNDRVQTLADLSERLFAAGVTPYYLHLLDRVEGASHFEVPEAEAVALYDHLRRRLPGYLVPRLVRDQAGAAFKQMAGDMATATGPGAGGHAA